MNTAIWKYALEVEDRQKILMPKNARILCVQTQAITMLGTKTESPCLWAMVDPEEDRRELREILIAGTGHTRDDLSEFTTYLGTFQLLGGSFVGHVFEAMFGREDAEQEA